MVLRHKQWNSFFILFTFFLDEKSNKKISDFYLS